MSKLEEDIVFQEWKECRESVSRFDQIIVDLRKYGFGFITLLFSANGFLFAQPQIGRAMVVAIQFALLAIVYGLFRVDRYHEVFLRAAVFRAQALEALRDMGITKVVSQFSEEGRTGTWGFMLYVYFGMAATILAIAGLYAKGAEAHQFLLACLILIFFLSLMIRHDCRTRQSLADTTRQLEMQEPPKEAPFCQTWICKLSTLQVPFFRKRSGAGISG
jgi:hypothetical protein